MDLPKLSGSDVATVMAEISSTCRLVDPPRRPRGVVLWMVLLLGAMIAGGLLLPGGWDLLAVFVCLAALLAMLGKAIVNRPLGVFINEQNVMSLSRFQMALWTIVVLASYISYALYRIHMNGLGGGNPGDKFDPLNIIIDPNLLILMGISTTSFVASPFILGTKRDKTPDAEVAAKTALKSGDSPFEVEDNRQGTLYANTRISDALITDMFQGDELGNTTHIDMAKVQMFFFTVISSLAYLVLIFHNLRTSGTDLTRLPTLSDGVVYALGISHTGYLASKGLDHTQVES